MSDTTKDTVVTVRAKAFSGCGVEEVWAIVDADGTVRVYDDVAGYYTSCHSLSDSAQRRIRRLARRREEAILRVINGETT